MSPAWKFSCEWKGEIPLPPEYSFAQAFNYLNAETNSFYILEAPNGNYIQCGGSKERCLVEVRTYQGSVYAHSILGKRNVSAEKTKLKMSAAEVELQENEIFRHWEAIELFKCFFEGRGFPSDIVARQTNI